MRFPRLREKIVCEGEFDVFRIIVAMPSVISDRGVLQELRDLVNFKELCEGDG